MVGLLRKRGGFTLVELVVVLALVGLLSALVVSGVGGRSQSQAERGVVQEIERALLTARVDAMRSAGERMVGVRFEGGAVELSGGGRDRLLDAAGLVAVDGEGAEVELLTARFQADGRTEERLWRLASSDVDLQRAYDLGLLRAAWESKEDLLDERRGRGGRSTGGRGIQGRLWLVRFDPISGVARVELLEDR